MAVENSVTLCQPVFLSFYPDSITFEPVGEMAELILVPEDKIAPSIEVKNLELVSRTTIQRNVLLVQTEIMLGAEHCQNVDPVWISEVIPKLLSTENCSHSYFDAYYLPKLATPNLPVRTANYDHGYNSQKEPAPTIGIYRTRRKKRSHANPFADMRQKWPSKSLNNRSL